MKRKYRYLWSGAAGAVLFLLVPWKATKGQPAATNSANSAAARGPSAEAPLDWVVAQGNWHVVSNGKSFHYMEPSGSCSWFDFDTYAEATNGAWTIYLGRMWEATNNNWKVVVKP